MGSVPGGLRMTEEREEALRQAYGLLQRTPTRTLISYLPVLGEFAVDGRRTIRQSVSDWKYAACVETPNTERRADMAKKRTAKPPPGLTLKSAGVPELTYLWPGDIPLANATDRFALLDWEDIHQKIVDGRVAVSTCEAGEVDTVMRHLYQLVHDADECCCPAMESRYDPSTGRLFVYSLVRDWSKVQKAG